MPPGSAVFTQNYSEAAAVDLWGAEDGLPRAVSQQNQYWLWGPGPARDADSALVISVDARQRRRLFRTCALIDHADNPWHIDTNEQRAPIYDCRGRKLSWEHFWKGAKLYT